MNIQFGYEAPAPYRLFCKWLTGEKAHKTACWFPYVDEDNLEEGYEEYRRRVRNGETVAKKQQTLRKSFKIKSEADRWILDMIKLGRFEMKKKGTCNIFKSLLLKKYGSDENLVPGWFNIKLNGAGDAPKHIARFQLTDKDIKEREKIVFKTNLLIPQLPTYRPTNTAVVREKTIRNIFE